MANNLSPHHELVLLMRFGQVHRSATLQEVADTLSMPLHTVRRLESEALTLLRVGAIDSVYWWCGWDEV